MTIDYWDAERLRAALPPEKAVAALRERLETDPPSVERSARYRRDTAFGQLLIMPDESSRHVGVKLISSSPGNRDLGLPLVQGTYVLMDSATGTPIAVMDAAELTMVRTSCVAMLAVSCLSPAAAPRVAIIGSGPQAVAHAEAARVLGASHVHAVVRSDAAAVRARALAASRGLELDVAGPEVLASSDVIVCATSSPVPVLDDADVAEHAVVAAIGAHEAHTRELPTSLMGRASVYVETRRSALADSGNVLIAERELGRHIITGELAELVSGTVRVPSDRPRVFVSVGESWEDLAVASVLAGAHR